MSSSDDAPGVGSKGLSRFERLANYTADHSWLIAKLVFGIHYLFWLGLTYFPIFRLVNSDTDIYRTAGNLIIQRQPVFWLNIAWPTQEPYYYSPQFAWLCSLFNFVDGRAFAFLFGLGLLLIPFLLSLRAWQDLISDLDLDKRTFNQWLPLVLLATSMITNFFYGNVVILLTGLLGVGLICVLRKRSFWAAAIIVTMVLTKPQFSAPLLVILLFGLLEKGSRKYVFQTVGYAIALYAGITAVFLLSVGPTYGLQSMVDQVQFLLQATTRYPYVTANVFFTVNHSFDQQFYRLGLGNYAWVSMIIKLLFGLYFIWLLYRSFRAGFRLTTHARYLVVLALMSYLVISSFTWELMELLVGPIVLAFLLSLGEGTTLPRWSRRLLVLLFVWELIMPVIMVVPTSLIALLILFWAGNQFVNGGLKSIALSLTPGRVVQDV